MPSRASVLRWPAITQARVLYQSSSASRSPLQHALEQLVGGVVLHVQLARERVLGARSLLRRRRRRRPRRSRRSRRPTKWSLFSSPSGQALRVAAAAACTPAIASPMLRPGVGDQAAPLDLRAGLRERGGERVADREVAQVADVQRLGRVGVPELDREALPVRRGPTSVRLGAAAGLERRRRSSRSSRRRGAARTPSRVARDRGAPTARCFELLERLQRVGVLLPVAARAAPASGRSPRCGRRGARAAHGDDRRRRARASSK